MSLSSLTHYCSHEAKLVIRILLAEEFLHRLQHSVSHLLQCIADDLLTFWCNQSLDINRLACFDELGEVPDDCTGCNVALSGNIPSAKTCIVHVKRHQFRRWTAIHWRSFLWFFLFFLFLRWFQTHHNAMGLTVVSNRVGEGYEVC